MIPYVPPPAGNLWVAAIFSILAGGAVAVAFHIAAPKLRHRFPRADSIVWALFAILTFAIVIQTRATDRMFGGYFSFKTPRERLQDHFADFERQVMRDPEIRAAVGGFPEVSVRLQTMGIQGTPRLDDATLRQRAKLMGIILSRLSDPACASLLWRAPPTESGQREVEQAMLQLGSGFVAEWMGVLHKSILAEARKSPVRPISGEELTAAYRALEARIGAEAAGRVAAGWKEGAPISECCWAGKTLYQVAPTLAEPHRTVLLRFIVRPP